ncbi:MFS transporter [soil metagenome]
MTTHINETRAPERAGMREWIALGVLMLPVLLVSIDNTVLSFALPSISTSLAPSGTQLLWIVDIYALMLAGLLISMGSLGDRIGRRKLLAIGSVGFGAASVIAAFSTSPEMLILSRALLGFFGASLMPSTLSLIRNIFVDRGQRRMAIATWAAMFSGGAALGPVVGGWLLEHFWWGSVFLINVPVLVLFLGLAYMFLPESRDPNPGPVDATSVVLSLTTMFPLVYAIKAFAEGGLSDEVIAGVVIGVVSLITFVRRQKRSSTPMLDVSLFSDKVFSGAIGANLLSMMGLAGFIYFAAQFLQLVVGLSPLNSAYALLPGLAATVVAGFAAVRVVRFVPIHLVIALSFVLSASGYAIAAFVGGVPTAWSLALAFAVLGIGIGFAETLTNDIVMTSVPAHKAGAAAAISETAYEIGAVLGTAVLGSILTATYRDHLEVPGSLPQVASDRAVETLGGAVETAERYPNGVGDQLLLSAQHAFDTGIQYVSAVAIILALGAAFISYRTLRSA